MQKPLNSVSALTTHTPANIGETSTRYSTLLPYKLLFTSENTATPIIYKSNIISCPLWNHDINSTCKTVWPILHYVKCPPSCGPVPSIQRLDDPRFQFTWKETAQDQIGSHNPSLQCYASHWLRTGRYKCIFS